MVYYINIPTTSSKEIPPTVEDFFTDWASKNDFLPQINALMANYDYCVMRKGQTMKLYNLRIIKHESSSPPTEIFKSVSDEVDTGLSEKLVIFMRKWGEANGYTRQIEALIDNYGKCYMPYLKKKEQEMINEELNLLDDALKVITRTQIGNDDIRWFCIPHKCKTVEDKLVCTEENAWKSFSLDEVTLILKCPKTLVASEIITEAKEKGIEIPENIDEYTFLYTKRSIYPYIINGGLLFCGRWANANIISEQKFTLSETVGDTTVTIGENSYKIIALYTILEDEKAELHLIDEFGMEHHINFDIKHPEDYSRNLPLGNTIINWCFAKLVSHLIAHQMAINGKCFSFGIKMCETFHLLILLTKMFHCRNNKLYLEDKEMFEVNIGDRDVTGMFKNT